jgi:NADPH:quinone reductase-like Zn-dependent oxidoreductase
MGSDLCGTVESVGDGVDSKWLSQLVVAGASSRAGVSSRQAIVFVCQFDSLDWLTAPFD